MKSAFKSASWLVAALPLLTGTVVLANEPMKPAADMQQPQVPSEQMQAVLDAHQSLKPKAPSTLSAADARKQPTARDAVAKVIKQEHKSSRPEHVAKVDNQKIAGPKGSIPVRVYTPDGQGPFPIIVYYHGGGFVLANLDTYDASARALTNQAHAVVVSVAYRLAPENPFPAAVDDADAAFRYVQENASKFNGDPKRVAVAGESAGGNLATVVAMREKQSAAPPVFELLVYPFVSTDLKTPSHQAYGQGNYFISNNDIAWFWKNYVGEGWQQNQNPEAVPLLADTAKLQGMPPTFIITAGLDPLKDEGQAYAKKLQAAGVKVEVKNYNGVTHEFFGMGAVVGQAQKAQADTALAFWNAFNNSPAMGGSGEPLPVNPAPVNK